MIKEFFNGKELYKVLNPEEAIVNRLTIEAAIRTIVKDVKMKNYF